MTSSGDVPPITAAILGTSLRDWVTALFSRFCKWRHEPVLPGSGGPEESWLLSVYSGRLLDRIIAVTATATIVTYSIFTCESHSGPANNAMMLTIPFVVFALIHYLVLAWPRSGGSNPEWLLFHLVPLLVPIAG